MIKRTKGAERTTPASCLNYQSVLTFVLAALTFSFSAQAADIDVLIIGSERDSSEDYRVNGDSAAFSAAGIKTQLENILGGAGLGTVHVEYEDRFRAYSYYDAYNLASWFHWPYPANVETTTRWPNLRGEGSNQWDYVILVGDPYTIEKMPGLFTLGAAKIGEEVAKGTNGAETVLLMSWPAAGSSSTVDHYKEVIYRTGRTGGFKVAPAGLAWQEAGSPTGATHPSDDGAYIAAASLFSRLWGQSASSSSYSYNDTLADSVHTTVTTNIGAVQYVGVFDHQNPFKPFWNKSRDTRPRKSGGGSSTEDGLVGATKDAITRAGALSGSGSSYYIGRDTYSPGGSKDYRQGSDWSTRQAFGYRYQTNTSNKDTHLGEIFYQDIDLADQMIPESDTFRVIPRRLIWASIHQVAPDEPAHGSHGHTSGNALVGCGSYMYTMISGRTPYDSSALEWIKVSSKAGYETAWRLMTCQSRAPGLKVLTTSQTVGFATPEVVSVEFLNPPQSNVTVTLSSTISNIVVSPQTLVFTPTNYNVLQQVTLLAQAGAAPGTSFNLDVVTTSGDEVYDNLTDTWTYTVNTPPVANAQTVDVYSEVLTPITLTGSDANGESLSFTITDQPTNGAVALNGAVATYQSNPGFLGPDSFTVIANDGSDDSQPVAVTLNVLPTTLYDYNLLENGSAELAPFTDHGWVEGLGTWGQSASTTDGSWSFYVAGNQSTAELYQDVDLSDFVERIDRGEQQFKLSGYGNSVNDDARFLLSWWDASDQLLMTNNSGKIGTGPMTYYEAIHLAPVGATRVRVTLYADQNAGGNSCRFDGMRLEGLVPPNGEPEAHSQSNITVTAVVPNSIPLSSRDMDGDAVQYTILSQPSQGTAVLTGSGSEVVYQTSGPYTGPDSFTFSVNDGEYDSNIATVSVDVVANQAPTIVLDSPTTNDVALPLNVGVLLETTVSDDGAPGPLTLTWSKVSGPGTVTFTNPNEADTGARFSSQGHYVLRLTADDGDVTVTEDVTVHFGYYTGYPNIGPHAETGLGYNGTVGVPFILDEANTSDVDSNPNPPGAVSVLWKLVSGPGMADFADETDINSSVMIDAVGSHELRLITTDGEVKSWNDVTATIAADPSNTQPVASNQSLTVLEHSVSNSLVLAGSDADTDPISYHLVSPPAHGSLAGALPNLTYTPDAGYFGSDSMSFRVNDGTADSAIGVISITVTEVPLAVNAGPDQSVTLVVDGNGPIGGAYFVWDASEDLDGNDRWPSTTGNAYDWVIEGGSNLMPVSVSDPLFSTLTNAYEFPAARSGTQPSIDASLDENSSGTWEFVLDTDTDDGLIMESGGTTDGFQFWIEGGVLKGQVRDSGQISTVSYTLTPDDKDGFIHIAYVIDMAADLFSLYVNNAEVDSASWTGSDWCGTDSAGLGRVGGAAPAGSVADFTGKIALVRFYQGNAFSAADVAHNYLSVVTASSVTVNLDGTVSGGPSLSSSWSLLSGPSVAPIADATLADTTITFPMTGVYTLQLTVADGGVPINDQVIITVTDTNSPSTSRGTLHSWYQSYGITNNFEAADLLDLDLDGALAWEEYLAGTDPTDPASVFCIMSTPMQGGNPELIWYGTMNSGVTTDFIIYRCTNLAENVWGQIATQSRHASGTNTWIDAGFSGKAYYRIAIVQ